MDQLHSLQPQGPRHWHLAHYVDSEQRARPFVLIEVWHPELPSLLICMQAVLYVAWPWLLMISITVVLGLSWCFKRLRPQFFKSMSSPPLLASSVFTSSTVPSTHMSTTPASNLRSLDYSYSGDASSKPISAFRVTIIVIGAGKSRYISRVQH